MTKTCFKCGRTKCLEEFYRHPETKDGHLGKCKSCTKQDALLRDYSDPEAARERDRLKYLKRIDKIRARNALPEVKARKSKSKAESLARYPERKAAGIVFRSAVRRGDVSPWPCCALPECNTRPQAHHPDYSRPLDVVWLCAKHHAAAHLLARTRKSL